MEQLYGTRRALTFLEERVFHVVGHWVRSDLF